MSEYEPLRVYLLRLDPDEWRASFDEIEEILGFGLPASARKYPAWWANEIDGQHSHAWAWLDAGWRTIDLDLGGERVTFLHAI